MNATFTSVVFLHLLHSGGTTLRQIFKKQLCEEGYGLHCWEGHGKGGIPKPFEARRPLQALYGSFPFQPASFRLVAGAAPFYMTVLAVRAASAAPGALRAARRPRLRRIRGRSCGRRTSS